MKFWQFLIICLLLINQPARALNVDLNMPWRAIIIAQIQSALISHDGSGDLQRAVHEADQILRLK